MLRYVGYKTNSVGVNGFQADVCSVSDGIIVDRGEGAVNDECRFRL